MRWDGGEYDRCKKRVIIVNLGFVDVVMFNPILVRKDSPYKTEEGCLSLPGIRKTTRYQTIEVEYLDMNWKKQNLKLDGWTAQICQHELEDVYKRQVILQNIQETSMVNTFQ